MAVITRQSSFNSEHKSVLMELNDSGAVDLAGVRAGQFVQIACRGYQKELMSIKLGPTILRRPFSIAGLSRETAADGGEKLYLEIIYWLVGPGTRWLAHQKAGEQISVMGPLGNGFTWAGEPNDKIILVGGGVGLGPLYLLAEQLQEAGYKNVIALAGAQNKDLFAGQLRQDKYQASEPLVAQQVVEQFSRSGAGCIAATDDGSFGYSGSVVEVLERYLDAHSGWKEAHIYACGPYGMLKATAALAQRSNMPCQVCMEAYMACGIGVCQSCVVPVREKDTCERDSGSQYKLVCSDGPVFDAKMIKWV